MAMLQLRTVLVNSGKNHYFLHPAFKSGYQGYLIGTMKLVDIHKHLDETIVHHFGSFHLLAAVTCADGKGIMAKMVVELFLTTPRTLPASFKQGSHFVFCKYQIIIFFLHSKSGIMME